MWQPTQSSLSNCAGEKRWVYLLLNKTTCLALRQEEGWNWRGEQRAWKRRKSSPRSLFTTGTGDWRGLSCCFWWLKAAAILANLSGMVQEALLPYLGQTVIYLRCSAPTANNQLKLAYFFTVVTEPATLSQLCASEQGSANPEKVLESLFLSVLLLSFVLFPFFFFFFSFDYVYNLPFLCYFENSDLFLVSSPTGRFCVLTVSCYNIHW